jgi:hypothetical protein
MISQMSPFAPHPYVPLTFIKNTAKKSCDFIRIITPQKMQVTSRTLHRKRRIMTAYKKPKKKGLLEISTLKIVVKSAPIRTPSSTLRLAFQLHISRPIGILIRLVLPTLLFVRLSRLRCVSEILAVRGMRTLFGFRSGTRSPSPTGRI